MMRIADTFTLDHWIDPDAYIYYFQAFKHAVQASMLEPLAGLFWLEPVLNFPNLDFLN